MQKTAFRVASRAQESLLAPYEKRALIAMARRMPPWIHSDHLTALGFAAMILAGLCYWAARHDRRALALVVVLLVLNWLGDSLDGTLARVRNRLRPRYGFYVDHITDAFGTLFLLGGLALSGYMSHGVAAGLLVIYFLLSIEVYLATYTIGTFHLSFWKFSPTELRLLLMIGNVALFFKPVVRLFGNEYLLFDVGGIVGLAGMSLMLITAAIKHTRALYRAETVQAIR